MVLSPNKNKMSDGGRGRASLGVEVWKSSQKWIVQRSGVRSIAWLDGLSARDKLINSHPLTVVVWKLALDRDSQPRLERGPNLGGFPTWLSENRDSCRRQNLLIDADGDNIPVCRIADRKTTPIWLEGARDGAALQIRE